jgi:cysteine synthase
VGDVLRTDGRGTSTDHWLKRAHTGSPLRELRIHRGSHCQSAWLKLEMFNPTGSVKYRTALSLLRRLDEDRPLTPGTTIVESTSGNLGLALAQLSAEIGCRYVAVVDPKVPHATREAIAATGAEIVTVGDRDEHNGFLLARLRKVHELCESSTARWANQYEGAANPAVHRDVTGPELVRQTRGLLDMVVVAVSTGGTLAGISEHLRSAGRPLRVLAVDVAGSLALDAAGTGRPHLLNGIGAGRRSSFLRPYHYDHVAQVRDMEAIAFCLLLEQDTGLALGGSSGAVLAAFVADLPHHPAPPRLPVLFCPDGGRAYSNTLYTNSWLVAQDALVAVLAVMADARRRGLRFELGEEISDVHI